MLAAAILTAGGERSRHPRVLARQRERELLATHPEPNEAPRVLTRVRSTLLSSALVELRDRGLFERYWEHLDPAARPEVESMIAGLWIPADVAIAHYAACDQLGLGSQDAYEIGRGIGKRIHDTILSMLTRAARGAGVTVWTAVGIYTRLYVRIFDGGTVHVYKTGPKDVEFQIERMQLLQFQYFRNSWAGVHHVGSSLFAERVFVRVVQGRDPYAATFRLSWV